MNDYVNGSAKAFMIVTQALRWAGGLTGALLLAARDCSATVSQDFVASGKRFRPGLGATPLQRWSGRKEIPV